MKPEEVQLEDYYMFIENFNQLIDTLIQQEVDDSSKKLSLIKDSLGKDIITATAERAVDVLEQLRYLPFLLRNGIFKEKEFNIYKKIKLKQLEKLIHTYENSDFFQSCSTSEKCINLKTEVRELKDEKKIVENSFWDNKYIILSSRPAQFCQNEENRKIAYILRSDTRKALELIESSYLILENNEYFHTAKVKLVKSLKVLSKYLQCVELDNKLDELTKKAIYSFKFPPTHHLKFSDTFFGLYPFVNCERFRKLCNDPRINEFCGNTEINGWLYQSDIKKEIAYNESHNLEDDYRVYIKTNTCVEKAYDKYVHDYSPYKNAEKFLRQKEEDFMLSDKDKYIEEIRKMQELSKHFFDDVPREIMDVAANCGFGFLHKYKGKYNDESLKYIIAMKKEYAANCKDGKQNYQLITQYQKEVFELLESIRKTFYSNDYISEFEKKYNCSHSVVDYLYNKSEIRVLDFVQSELQKIEDEFKILHQYLMEKRQELVEAKKKVIQMDIDIRPLVFDDKDMKEIKKSSLDFTPFWYERLQYNDIGIYYSEDMRIKLWQIPGAEELAYSYGIFLVDCIVAEFAPKFRKEYYSSKKSIDYNLLEEFKQKIKIIK